MDNLQVINLKETSNHTIKKLIDLAGFNTRGYKLPCGQYVFKLTDKKNSNSDEYSDLTFGSLFEAVRAVTPYLSNNFIIV